MILTSPTSPRVFNTHLSVPTQEKLPHLLDTRTLTFSYSRLLPKPDGVRLIVNMSRRIGQVQW